MVEGPAGITPQWALTAGSPHVPPLHRPALGRAALPWGWALCRGLGGAGAGSRSLETWHLAPARALEPRLPGAWDPPSRTGGSCGFPGAQTLLLSASPRDDFTLPLVVMQTLRGPVGDLGDSLIFQCGVWEVEAPQSQVRSVNQWFQLATPARPPRA